MFGLAGATLSDQFQHLVASKAHLVGSKSEHSISRLPSTDFDTPTALAAQRKANCNLSSFLEMLPMDAEDTKFILQADMVAVHTDTMQHLCMLLSHYERTRSSQQDGAELNTAQEYPDHYEVRISYTMHRGQSPGVARGCFRADAGP
jgi:hypothetical protein